MSHQRAGRVYLFDVNETLLDLSSLDQAFQRVFGDAGVRRQWFQQVLQSALVSTVIEDYADFTRVQQAAGEMLARRLGVGTTSGCARRAGAAPRGGPASSHPDQFSS